MTNPHDIIKKPVVTEQSMMEMANKKYTFVVAKDANKTEIKKAVEAIFGVNVEKEWVDMKEELQALRKQ